jgi:quinol monooxygenase YgiN
MAIVRTACTMTLDRGDLAEVEGIFRTFIKDVQEKDHGVLTYDYYVDDDPLLIHVFEAYESSQAHLDHFANIDQQAVARLLALVELSALHYYGVPSAEEKALLANFGTVFYHRPLAGFEAPAVRA